MKKITLSLIALSMISLLTPQITLADRDCATLLKGECVGCHEKEKYCDYLGKKERFWKGMLSLMESNGAELTNIEKTGLTECLSTPSDTAKNICK